MTWTATRPLTSPRHSWTRKAGYHTANRHPTTSLSIPLGACPCCKGLGYINLIDRDKIIPDASLSIYNGAIVPLGKYRNSMIFWQIDAICKKYGHTLKTPVKDLCEEALGDILNGTNERLVIENETMATNNYFQSYDGLVKYIEMQQADDASASAKNGAKGSLHAVYVPNAKATVSTKRLSTSLSTAKT